MLLAFLIVALIVGIVAWCWVDAPNAPPQGAEQFRCAVIQGSDEKSVALQ
jgi:hypothetical protein